MKQTVGFLVMIGCVIGVFAQTKGYQISVQIKPLKKTWVYMGYHYGNMMPISDSIFVDNEGKGVFKGPKPLPQGIYVMAGSKNSILFELLIGKQQTFSILSDTTNPEKLTKFVGSPENEQFKAYTDYISIRARAIEADRKKQMASQDPSDKKMIQTDMDKNIKEMDAYRKNVIKTQPTSLLAAIFKSMQEVILPTALSHPKTLQDSLNAYYWSRSHYWDGVDFTDGRLVRTPIFEKKLKFYLDNYIRPEPDSIIHEFNWMIAYGRNDQEMFHFLIGYFVDNYFNPKIMGQDKVFLHVYEKYFATNQVDWLNEKQMKQITDRAMMIMSNQVGEPAADMKLIDTAGKTVSLYETQANFTVVVFWDPDCGKCKEEVPKMDSLYNTEWKGENVKVYAVMVAENNIVDWKKFIQKYGRDWIHVHQTIDMRAEEEKNKVPNFHQLYDVRSTPTIYLLDKDKRIIAKNLSLEDMDRVMQQKIKNGK
jgi:peroxiredoxin